MSAAAIPPVLAHELIATLSSLEWTVEDICRKFRIKRKDRRQDGMLISRFILRNSLNFNFLGMRATTVNIRGEAALRLSSSNYAGVIPVFSPLDGRIVGELSVVGRFGEDAAELIDLLSEDIVPDYEERLPLLRPSPIKSPVFLDCCRYVDAFIAAKKYHWQKFDNRLSSEREARSSTLWKEYAVRTACNPNSIGTFCNKRNLLTTDHMQWRQLAYVLRMAMDMVESAGAPRRLRAAYADRIAAMRRYVMSLSPLPVKEFTVSHTDPTIITDLKERANRILGNRRNEQIAWRIDYSLFFERYVQYIFSESARRCGLALRNNVRFCVNHSVRASWMLAYIEPDAIVGSGDEQIIVDAKYKSHIFNIHSGGSEMLAETFRHDLHQVLAYAGFSGARVKKAMLVYPSSQPKSFVQQIVGANDCRAMVWLVGVPVSRALLADTLDFVGELLAGCQKSTEMRMLN